MRKILSFSIIGACLVLCLLACKKWVDPPPTNNSNLTNPYCNDPNAVNYNWGFPGRPDDSVCFYPVDLFRGRYIYMDSIYLADMTFIGTHADTLNIFALSLTQLGVLGFCSAGDTMHITSYLPYNASVDTTLYTLAGGAGQQFCRTVDTVSGTLIRDQIDTTQLHINLTEVSDTGVTLHIGTAIKQ